MAELEDMGISATPHTQRGRLPTDKAYRFYVESFPPPQSAKATSGETLPTRRRGSTASWSERSSHLSSATKLTGLLLAPPLKQTTLARST